MKTVSIILFGLLATPHTWGQGQTRSVIDTIVIESEPTLAPESLGSAHKVGKKELEKMQTSDVHQVLKSVPGVYVQEEEGEGLRPNIGLRGAHPHRSKKITLMEDGLLIAPAPYSAPAAYYFPQMENIETLEVFKGPSSSRFGPNSIGGVVNLISRDYPQAQSVKTGFSYGSFDTKKLDVAVGESEGRTHWLVHGTGIQSAGFKHLPNEGSTGFNKVNTGFKLRRILSTHQSKSMDLKFNFAGEQSHETYLGLASSDFNKDSTQRYAASERDEFTSNHRQFQAAYSQQLFEESYFSATLYRHEFDRVWSKFQGFANKDAKLDEILSSPQGRHNSFYRVLTGQQNTLTPGEELVLGHNDRSYLSQGLQVDSSWGLPNGNRLQAHFLDLGVRWHFDSVDRNHTTEHFVMRNLNLESASTPAVDPSGQNIDSSTSLSAYLNYNLEFQNIKMRAGSRVDHVESLREDKLQIEQKRRIDNLITPGLALAYQLSGHTFFSGVHKGMNLVGPGQEDNVQPEESLNYELGYRWQGPIQFELIGFFSDYSNLVGVCSLSAGCSGAQVGQKFNGGNAHIYGVEMAAQSQAQIKNYRIPIRLSLTSTQAEFAQGFESDNPEWGDGKIEPGDPLPYVPEVQAQLGIGLKFSKWLFETTVNYKGTSFDQSVAENRKRVDPYGTLGLLAQYQKTKEQQFFIKGENLLNNEYVVSYRPYGARPGKPFTLQAGASLSF